MAQFIHNYAIAFRILHYIAVGTLFFLYGCQPVSGPFQTKTPPATAVQPKKADHTQPAIQNNTLASDSPGNRQQTPNDDPTLPVATYVDARPAALINGMQINWGELRPLLNEAAGADILEEIIIDKMLEQKIDDAHIIITDSDTKRERDLLLRTLSDDQNLARRLLEELRIRRGLGEQRFQRLLIRNARLRALVADRIQVTEEQVRRLYEIKHGPKRQPRLMILPDLTLAQLAIQRIQSGGSFADVAVEFSVDSSASRGGLLEPISRTDPAYPSSLREELWKMQVGEISSPILIHDQYAILQLVRTVTADDIAYESVQDQLRHAAKINQQRLLMDQLIERVMSDISVTIFDESLRAAWKQRNPG